LSEIHVGERFVVSQACEEGDISLIFSLLTAEKCSHTITSSIKEYAILNRLGQGTEQAHGTNPKEFFERMSKADG